MKRRFGDDRDDHLGKRPSMPPRTRPSATYPGGKFLRKAHAKLAALNANIPTVTAKGNPIPADAYSRAGSMTR